MTAICPNCGADLVQDVPIERAGLSMFPYGNVRYNGAEVTLTKGESAILWALMKADLPLPRHILAERANYDGDSNVVDVLLTRIRQKLADHGPVPIRSIRGVGVYIAG